MTAKVGGLGFDPHDLSACFYPDLPPNLVVVRSQLHQQPLIFLESNTTFTRAGQHGSALRGTVKIVMWMQTEPCLTEPAQHGYNNRAGPGWHGINDDVNATKLANHTEHAQYPRSTLFHVWIYSPSCRSRSCSSLGNLNDGHWRRLDKRRDPPHKLVELWGEARRAKMNSITVLRLQFLVAQCLLCEAFLFRMRFSRWRTSAGIAEKRVHN